MTNDAKKILMELEPSEEVLSIKRAEAKEEHILRNKQRYNALDETCPVCEYHPLEHETMGYEQSVFCVRCNYYRATNLN